MRIGLLTGCLVVFGTTARAEETDGKVAATALFHEAQGLVGTGKLDEACPKFEAARRAAPGVGIELNLADCWERVGRTASAWRSYVHVASVALPSDRRRRYAKHRAMALAARLARVVIRVEGDQPDLEVRQDNEVVETRLLGLAVPIDPGTHTFEASAPGKLDWRTTMAIAPATTETVEVPILKETPAPIAAPPIEIATTTSAVASPEAPVIQQPDRRPSPSRRLVAVGVGGAGILALGASATLAIMARAEYNDAVELHCFGKLTCDPTGSEAIHSARSKGTAATVTAGVGLAAVVTGVVLYVTAPKSRRVAPLIGPTVAGIAIEGVL